MLYKISTYNFRNFAQLCAVCVVIQSSVFSQAPGGVDTDLTTWFKASSLTTGTVTNWASPIIDLDAPTGVVVSQGTVSRRPICFDYSTDETRSKGINFNSGILFDGVDDELINSVHGHILGPTGSAYLAYRHPTANIAFQGPSSFASQVAPGEAVYQMKNGNCGYTNTPTSTTWQKWQGTTLLPTMNTKMRISIMNGGITSCSDCAFRRNGNINTANSSIVAGATLGTASVRISFGSNGGTEFSGSTITEFISYKRKLTVNEQDRIDSYLAIKYGITLGVNGTGKDYLSANSAVIWEQTSNSGYAFDIAGIGREDLSALDQRKSHSINGPEESTYSDILTIANGDFSTPSDIANESFFIWGHNGAPTINTGALVYYTTDNSETIETIFQRQWKAQETNTISTLTLEFDMNNVIGVGGMPGVNDLANLRLLVDEDGDFSVGATSISPSSFDNTTNIVYFQHDFIPGTANQMDQNRGFFFTLGSVNYLLTPLPIELSAFNGSCEGINNKLNWETQSEINNEYFEIQRMSEESEWRLLGIVQGAGNSSITNHYSFLDKEPLELTVYYRLKQVDFDGNFEYSRIISVYCENRDTFLVYPNPFNNEIRIEFDGENESSYFEIIDTKGAIIYKDSFNKKTIVEMNNVASGVYFLRLKNRSKIEVVKIVKHY